MTKRYSSVVAVDSISFTVEEGEIFGILGPNGAGKTTTLEMIEGLRSPDSGEIRVLGLDAICQRQKVREQVGVQLQAASLIRNLTVWETLSLFVGLYSRQADLEMLLSRFSLGDKRDGLVGHLSGGQQQRLSVALAFVNDPPLVFLDEPSAGLDPVSRRSLWDLIKEMRSQGRTIILTTHYMEEAEALCSRVAIMDRGTVLALDSPGNLVRSIDASRTLECVLEGATDTDFLSCLPGVTWVGKVEQVTLLSTSDPMATTRSLLKLEEQGRLKIADLTIKSATLEAVFIHLTGRRLRDE